jgi:hypothetical protein
MPNYALQQTWPSISTGMFPAPDGFGFGQMVLLPRAGHAAEREC